MMWKLSASLILLAGLVAISASGSAIKGHHPAQPVQRVEEQAPAKGSLKSPASQQAERNPKSAPTGAHPATPILESSKKVYNDVSYRRSATSQQQQQQASEHQSPIGAKSSPVVEPVVSAQQPAAPVQQPAPAVAVVEQAAAPVQSAPVAPAKEEPAKVASAPVAAVPVEQAPKVAEVPVVAAVKPSEELPAQSDRSAPVKDEVKPQAAAVYSSPVAVEQVEPAKNSVVVPVVAPQQQQQQQQAPVTESKPVSSDAVQPAPSAPVVAQSQPEAFIEPLKPTMVDSTLQPKKDEPVAVKDSNEPIEVPAPDPGLVLSEPIDSTTKLLIDLDEHVQKFLPAEDKQEPAQPAKEAILISGVDYSPAQSHASDSQPSGKSSVPLVPYSSNVENEPIVPPLPSSLDKVEKATSAQGAAAPSGSGVASGQSATRQANHQHQNQQQVITQLLDQLDSLQNRIQDTINQLVARRRYVMSALLRPMGTYVRRVRTNLERLQTRVNSLQAAATSVGGNNNQTQRPGGFVDAAAIETIRRRIDDISKRISDIVNRIRFSLTPTSAPLNNNGRK